MRDYKGVFETPSSPSKLQKMGPKENMTPTCLNLFLSPEPSQKRYNKMN